MNPYKSYVVVCFWTSRDGSTNRREIGVLAKDEQDAKNTAELQLPKEAFERGSGLQVRIKSVR